MTDKDLYNIPADSWNPQWFKQWKHYNQLLFVNLTSSKIGTQKICSDKNLLITLQGLCDQGSCQSYHKVSQDRDCDASY